MTNTPKYFLDDVPHNLRSRVLDLCIRRLYHEALELLQQHGFDYYNRDDLINFYHWAPATLDDPAPGPEPTIDSPRDYPPPSPELLAEICKRLNELPPELAQQVDQDLRTKSIEHVANFLWKAGFPFTSGELYEYRKTLFPPNAMVDCYTAGPPVLRTESSKSSDATAEPSHAPSPGTAVLDAAPPAPKDAQPLPTTADNGRLGTNTLPPDPEPGTLSPEPSTPGITPPEPSVASEPPVPVIPKRKGKISVLPKAIRQRVNEMLDEGFTYEAIIEWLDQSGFPGINKVNMHNWHKGGFQDWLREQERVENQTAQREWLGDIITQSQPGDLHQCIYTLFASQIMDSLFGINTASLKEGLAKRPRDYIALMNGFRRMDQQITLAPEFQDFLKRKRERQKGQGGLSPEAAYALLRELRLDHLLARARECHEYKQQVKLG